MARARPMLTIGIALNVVAAENDGQIDFQTHKCVEIKNRVDYKSVAEDSVNWANIGKSLIKNKFLLVPSTYRILIRSENWETWN